MDHERGNQRWDTRGEVQPVTICPTFVGTFLPALSPCPSCPRAPSARRASNTNDTTKHLNATPTTPQNTSTACMNWDSAPQRERMGAWRTHCGYPVEQSPCKGGGGATACLHNRPHLPTCTGSRQRTPRRCAGAQLPGPSQSPRPGRAPGLAGRPSHRGVPVALGGSGGRSGGVEWRE